MLAPGSKEDLEEDYRLQGSGCCLVFFVCFLNLIRAFDLCLLTENKLFDLC